MITEIAILDHEYGEVLFTKVDDAVIAENYGDDIERYISEGLGYKMDEISYMCGTCLSCTMHGGIPSGGLTVTQDSHGREKS